MNHSGREFLSDLHFSFFTNLSTLIAMSVKMDAVQKSPSSMRKILTIRVSLGFSKDETLNGWAKKIVYGN